MSDRTILHALSFSESRRATLTARHHYIDLELASIGARTTPRYLANRHHPPRHVIHLAVNTEPTGVFASKAMSTG